MVGERSIKLATSVLDDCSVSELQSMDQIGRFAREFNVPNDKRIVLLARVYFSLQITIVASFLWMPWSNALRAVSFLLFCIGLDAFRVLLWKPARRVVFDPKGLLSPTRLTLDTVGKRDSTILCIFFVVCCFLPVIVMLLPEYISAVLSKVIYNIPFIEVFKNLRQYEFNSPENQKDSTDFLVMLQAICGIYLIVLSTVSLKTWDYRSVSNSKVYIARSNAKAIDIGNSLSIAVAVLIVLAAAYHFFSPGPQKDPIYQNYDWLGPTAMWLYGLIAYSILFVFQAITRGLLLATQVYFASNCE